MQVRPNLFIVGAPKAGTTSLSHYLSTHPDIFIPEVKEPYFWLDDYPILRNAYGIPSSSKYYSLFERAADTAVIGEASTLYLFSAVAVPRILQQIPNAKFVVCIRNPVDLAYAFHRQQVLMGIENIVDFELAWRLQEGRRDGFDLPSACHDSVLLQYREIASLGRQLKRFTDLVPQDQRLVIFFDDLYADSRSVYLQVLQFLDVPDDGRESFPIINEARLPRSPRVMNFMLTPSWRMAAHAVKKSLPRRLLPKLKGVKDVLLSRRAPRQPLTRAFRNELVLDFRSEVSLIQDVTARDLSDWC